MHTFPSAPSVSISSSICDSYTVSWLATHRVAINQAPAGVKEGLNKELAAG
jgi:hypothetical protein